MGVLSTTQPLHFVWSFKVEMAVRREIKTVVDKHFNIS
jgi:hypothetical protein